MPYLSAHRLSFFNSESLSLSFWEKFLNFLTSADSLRIKFRSVLNRGGYIVMLLFRILSLNSLTPPFPKRVILIKTCFLDGHPRSNGTSFLMGLSMLSLPDTGAEPARTNWWKVAAPWSQETWILLVAFLPASPFISVSLHHLPNLPDKQALRSFQLSRSGVLQGCSLILTVHSRHTRLNCRFLFPENLPLFSLRHTSIRPPHHFPLQLYLEGRRMSLHYRTFSLWILRDWW